MAQAEKVPSFDSFMKYFEENQQIHEKIRLIASDIDKINQQLTSSLQPVHTGDTDSVAHATTTAKPQVPELAVKFEELAGILKEKPGGFYRFHWMWAHALQTTVFLLLFIHWLETGALLDYADVLSQLNISGESEQLVEPEDYLLGVCSLSNEMPRYVVNRVTAGDYEVPQRVSAFLSGLFSAFRLLNLRNDALRKRYDGIKYDVKRVEEVLYDVKIRGLNKA